MSVEPLPGHIRYLAFPGLFWYSRPRVREDCFETFSRFQDHRSLVFEIGKCRPFARRLVGRLRQQEEALIIP